MSSQRSFHVPPARINKLVSFGLVPESEICLVSRRSAVALQCGAMSIAVKGEIGRDIYVRIDMERYRSRRASPSLPQKPVPLGALTV